MLQEGRAPNEITYSCILDTLAGGELQVLAEGKRLHTRVSSISNVVITTSLVNMYGNCGRPEAALEAFRERKLQNVLLWNSAFAVCNRYDRGEEVLDLFVEMHREEAAIVMPDNFTISNVLCACASQVAMCEGRNVQSLAVECDFVQDAIVGTALVNMYGKCGSMEDARSVFDRIDAKDVVLWSALIDVYAQHGYGREVVRLFHEMKQGHIVPNKITYVSALTACSRAGLINEGRELFASMEQDHGVIPAKEHCDCMVDLLARLGSLDEAEELIKNMPFSITYASWTTILGACKNKHDIERGERIGTHLIEVYPEEASLYVTLAQIYTLAGREIDAADVLEKMRATCAQ
jgi:pentatricopeptide repeat protein